mmetsp:Transcript_38813/g.58999  ORF Transcript_38813/g.58999 Transcript_38813/m.58999 type:complete len:173 (+) Transcript_38813:1237-1755(+)
MEIEDGRQMDGEAVEAEERDPPLAEPEIEVFAQDDNSTSMMPLSYKKVKAYQEKMHPRDPETKAAFPWFDTDISFLPMTSKMIKKTEWVTEGAKGIGLGPTLFLFTMKAFIYMFLVFIILSIPLMMFYAKGQGPIGLEKVKSGQFTDKLAEISVGNLGVSDFSCSNFNVARL